MFSVLHTPDFSVNAKFLLLTVIHFKDNGRVGEKLFRLNYQTKWPQKKPRACLASRRDVTNSQSDVPSTTQHDPANSRNWPHPDTLSAGFSHPTLHCKNEPTPRSRVVDVAYVQTSNSLTHKIKTQTNSWMLSMSIL